jgi:type II secretory ATPase GspE/PulE/Tfp pilus assembly ATPase PilB-like protein
MAKKRTRLHGLIDSGFLSAGDLASAYDIAAKEGESIESVIIKIFKVSKKTILACISAFCKLPQWSLDSPNLSFPAGLSQMLAGKYEALKSELFVPVAAEGRKIIVAMANPEDIIKRDYIQKFFPNREVEFRVGITDDIAFAVDVFCGVNIDTTKKSMEAILHEMKSEAVAEPIAAGSDDLEIQENDSAVVRLVNNIIEDASNRGVSDIHIEPSLDGDVLVRYRIDGLMSRAHVFPRKFRNPVSARIKIMSELDITEKRKPQSGKIRFRRWGSKDIELRVETYTTASGAEDR